MSAIRTLPEHLTIAYIAIGASRAIMENPDDFDATDWDGEVDFIEAVTAHALMLDRLADEVDANGGFSGVFAYEVAEEFGRQYGEALLKDHANADATAIARRLVEEAAA